VEGGVPYGKPTKRVVLKAYEGYWDRNYPKVEGVVFDNTLIGDREKAMRLCREGEGDVDVVSFIRPLDTVKVAESRYAKTEKSRDVAITMANLNQRKRASKWTDIRLRKAVNYAINREELWKYVAKGNAYNLQGSLLPPGSYGHNPKLIPYKYDTQRAKALLTEAGYSKGFKVKIITVEALKVLAQVMGKMLQRIGLTVELDVMAVPEFWTKWYVPLLDKAPIEQEWDLAIYHLYDIYGHTGASLLTFGYTEESNIRWMEHDSVYERMWKDMSRTVHASAQEAKIQQLEQYLHDRAHVLSIYSPITLYAVNKEVNFVPQKDGWLRFKETSVTDRHWSMRGKKN
jgi:ABC-type transport system substrate-binding protein